jgi:hypothetical protein
VSCRNGIGPADLLDVLPETEFDVGALLKAELERVFFMSKPPPPAARHFKVRSTLISRRSADILRGAHETLRARRHWTQTLWASMDMSTG